MFNSQLFFFAAVLLTSDVAEAKAPQKFLSVFNSTRSFEELASIAHWLSALAYLQFDGVQGSPERALAVADNSVADVLQTTDPKKIPHRLTKALEAEVRALVKVNQGCLSLKIASNPSMKSIYDKARGFLELAVLYLIEVIAKTEIDESKKTQIHELREDFSNKDFNNASNATDHIRRLGENVLKVMNAS